jgi:hypothetical protein
MIRLSGRAHKPVSVERRSERHRAGVGRRLAMSSSHFLALPIALVLLTPSAGRAQPSESFQDLALRINLDDQVRVVDTSGTSTKGRVTRLTREDLAIQTDAGEKRFASDAVREVGVRSHALRKGALIGAVAYAVLGAVANCSHEGRDACVLVGSLAGAPIGAGLGLATGALIPHMRTVYRAPENAASVSQSRSAVGVQGGAEDFALRINLDDQLQVDDTSGGRAIGRVTRMTADEITIRTSTGEQHFTRQTVRQVAVRRQPLRMAVLIGAGAGAVTGAVAACTGSDREECADAPIIVGGVGAGLGLVVGALIHHTTIVYPEPQKRARITPLISRGVVGVRASLRW